MTFVTSDRLCELLVRARDERGVDLIGATLPSPALAVPIAEAAGVTIDCFHRDDLRLGWSGCLVGHEHRLGRETVLSLIKKALMADRLWSDEQPADRWRFPVHSDRSLARLGSQTFFAPHVTACAAALVKVSRHADAVGAVLGKFERYGEALTTWLGSNMPDVLNPPLMPGEELDQLISEFIEQKALKGRPEEALSSGRTIVLAPARRKSA